MRSNHKRTKGPTGNRSKALDIFKMSTIIKFWPIFYHICHAMLHVLFLSSKSNKYVLFDVLQGCVETLEALFLFEKWAFHVICVDTGQRI